MKLYEFINPSDAITFYAPDNDIAEAIAFCVGKGKAGIRAVDGNETPETITFINLGGLPDDQAKRFEETMTNRINEVIAAGKTFAVVSSGYREEYDTLTENSTNADWIKKWDDKHRTSINDICNYARTLQIKEPV